MKNIFILIHVVLCSLSCCYGQVWQGTVTTANGNFDYEINTITDKMTLSNPTGFITNYGGFASGSITMVAVVTNPTAGMANISLSDDATSAVLFTGLDDSYMTSGFSALALNKGDGWFWVAENSIVNSSSYPDALIGANQINYEENGAAWDISYSFAYTNGGATNQLFAGQVSTPVRVPEPSALMFASVAGLLGLTRRRR